jgi:hypothetical protein
MDWEVVLPRVGAALEPGAVLAIVNRSWGNVPGLRERMLPLYERYSPVNREGTIEERDGRLQLDVTASITWGMPANNT